MTEIGATLREARTRARVDIAEIETATKIRAKYLRALENEEWELLPGPTFVKSFLRTYAEALGLDAKLLVDEYKLRHERLADTELRPISARPQAASGRAGRPPRRGPGGSLRAGGGGGRVPRGVVLLVLLLLVIGILGAIGLTQGDDGEPVAAKSGPSSTTTPAPTTSSAASPGTAAPARRRRRFATLRVLPTGNVNVCLRARGQGTLINGVELRRGENSETFRSSRFVLILGNNAARLRINDRTVRPGASARPIGYVITPTQRKRLAASDQRPCR